MRRSKAIATSRARGSTCRRLDVRMSAPLEGDCDLTPTMGACGRMTVRMSAPLEGDCDTRIRRRRSRSSSRPNECAARRRLRPINTTRTVCACLRPNECAARRRLRHCPPARPCRSSGRYVRMSAPLEGDCDSCHPREWRQPALCVRMSAPLEGDCDFHQLELPGKALPSE